MTLLRLYVRDALLAEMEIAAEAVEVGTQPGDTVRLDELGVRGADGLGGRLERREGAWTFVRRDRPDTPPERLSHGQRLVLGDVSLELEPERAGARLAMPAALPPPCGLAAPDAPGTPAPPAPPRGESVTSARFHALADVLHHPADGLAPDAWRRADLGAALALLEAHEACVAHLERDGRTLRVIAGEPPAAAGPGLTLPAEVAEAVLLRGEELLASGATGRCVLPLRSAGRVVGLLWADRGPGQAPWTSDDRAYLRLLSVVVARRLQNDERVPPATAAAHAPGAGHDDAAAPVGWGSPAMVRVQHEAERILRAFESRSLPVLITGESGTGKDVLARWLHDRVERRVRGPFVAINCAAIPHELAESELFGIERGVASGVIRRLGRFEQAHGGTLFLDEIGAMSLPIQAKVLRVLETHRVRRVGGRDEVPVHVRIVAATNTALPEAVRAGQFREDLYWRLAGVELRLPPLRQRREDIPVLALAFAEHFAREFGLPPLRFDRAAMNRLLAWSWPGNVRELRQRIASLAAASEGGMVREEDLPAELRGEAEASRPPGATGRADTLRPLAEVELEHMRRVVAALGGNRRRAAEILGIHRKTLARRLAEDAAPQRP